MIYTMISSSALILAIVLLRLILNDKISPNIRYGLWGLVVLRLVWPVFGTYIYVPLKGLADPLRSRFSVMNAADAVHRQVIAGTSLEYLTDNVATGHVYHFNDAGQTVTLAQRAAGIDWQLWIMGAGKHASGIVDVHGQQPLPQDADQQKKAILRNHAGFCDRTGLCGGRNTIPLLLWVGNG